MARKIIYHFLFTFLIPFIALAQNQGTPMGLGGGGQRTFCYVNEAGTDIADEEGDANYLTCDESGAQRVIGTVSTSTTKGSTSTLSNVADQATSTTCLALNADRLGAEFYNDSTEIAYLKKGATASATSYTVRLSPQDYYFQQDGYTGIYDCIWANNAAGSMRVTQVTP